MKIVIVGAGVAGLAIGWRCVQGGADVTVLDRAQPGRGATWAAAGMIAGTAEMGEARTPEAMLAAEAGALWPAFASEVEAASGMTISFRENGALLVAADAEQESAMRARAMRQGFAWAEPGELFRRVPFVSRNARGAIWAPGEAQVDNRALADALALAFVRAGGRILTNEPVVRIECAGGGAAAVTPLGRFEADVVLLAAGAWSGGIGGVPPGIARAVTPVKGEILELTPPDPVMLPNCVLWGEGIYLAPRGGKLLVGATVEKRGFDTRATAEAAKLLRHQAVMLAPPLASWSVSDHWAGLRPASADGAPLLGPSGTDGLMVAAGQYRNGILFAPAIADRMTAQLLHGAPADPVFDPRRFA